MPSLYCSVTSHCTVLYCTCTVPVLQRDQHHVLVQQVVGVILGRGAAGEAAAVDPDDDGPPLGGDQVPGEHVQPEAVLDRVSNGGSRRFHNQRNWDGREGLADHFSKVRLKLYLVAHPDVGFGGQVLGTHVPVSFGLDYSLPARSEDRRPEPELAHWRLHVLDSPEGEDPPPRPRLLDGAPQHAQLGLGHRELPLSADLWVQ